MFFGKNWIFSSSYRGYRDCLAIVSRLRAYCKSFSMSRNFFVIVSLLPNPWKARVFSFIMQTWQFFFKHLDFPSHYLSQTPFNPKSLFTQTSSFSSKNFCKITSRYVFLNIVFIFVLDYANFSLGLWDLGIFEKLGWDSYFCEIFSKIWMGWVPFAVLVSVLASCGILSVY